ncbi:MAG: secretin and TonB N-terminal domain-containing protein [Capsulimonas sp.]|uniref:secretin and TonB N-terminal domain-containing protein n=1 Tax=Capsulimonas sp. TaxID=2494211 RepID=UPI003265D7B1
MSKKKIILPALFVLTMGLIGVGSAASAQDNSPSASSASQQKVTLNFKNAPIQDILKSLFDATGLNYTIASDVVGTLTMHLSNTSAETALRSILRASNPPLTYDLTDNIYQIKVKHPSGETSAH